MSREPVFTKVSEPGATRTRYDVTVDGVRLGAVRSHGDDRLWTVVNAAGVVLTRYARTRADAAGWLTDPGLNRCLNR